MKKIITRLLLVLMILSAILPVSAATVSEPVPAASSKPGNPDKESVAAAIREFKDLSRKERKARIKEAKKAFKDYRAKKKSWRNMNPCMLNRPTKVSTCSRLRTAMEK